jgi:hypothetical protein
MKAILFFLVSIYSLRTETLTYLPFQFLDNGGKFQFHSLLGDRVGFGTTTYPLSNEKLRLIGNYIHPKQNFLKENRFAISYFPNSLGFTLGYLESNDKRYLAGIEFNFRPEKTLELHYLINPNSKENQISVHLTSGSIIQWGASIHKSKKFDENQISGNLYLSFRFDFLNAGLVSHSRPKEQNLNNQTIGLLGLSYGKIDKKTYNPKFLPESIYFKKILKKPILSKFIKPLFKKKKKKMEVYPLKLDELISKKIPIREALLIANATKNPEEYYKLLKKLPTDTKRKVLSLQFEKNGAKKK